MEKFGAFNNHLPVKVRFGEGVAETLPDVVRELDCSKVFLMVDEGIEKFNPAAAQLIEKMKSEDVVDAAVQYAQHIPVNVIARMLGFPPTKALAVVTADPVRVMGPALGSLAM